jgi:membrane protein
MTREQRRRPRLPDLWQILKDSGSAWDEDNAISEGAALAFFTIFSLSPLLILVVVLSSIGFGREAAGGHLVTEIRGLIGTEGAKFIQGLVKNAYMSDSSVPAAVFGALMLVLGASAVFIQLRDSLNAIWRVKEKPIGTIRGFVRSRLLSFAMIVGLGFLLLVSLVVSAGLSALGEFVSTSFKDLIVLVHVLDLVLSFAGITLVFALLFKYLPNAVLQWRDVWIGAAATSFLFSIGKFGIGLYLGNTAVGSTFGAASSLAIVMFWTYYSSQIVLFGAEITRFYADRFGAGIHPAHNAVRLEIRKVEEPAGTQPQGEGASG